MIKNSLRKGFQITRESTFPILMWLIFNLIAGFFTKSIFIDQIGENEGFAFSSLSILTWTSFLIIYIYLHAATLVYVRSTILLENQGKTDFLFKGLKYVFPIISFNLIFFFFLVILALIFIFIFITSPTVGFFNGSNASQPFQIVFISGLIITTAIAGILYCLCLLYSSTIIVAENSKVSTAIEKSIKVMRRHFWQTLGLAILSAFPIAILQVLGLFDDHFADYRSIQVGVLILSALIASLFEIFVSSVIMDFYLKYCRLSPVRVSE